MDDHAKFEDDRRRNAASRALTRQSLLFISAISTKAPVTMATMSPPAPKSIGGFGLP